MIIEKLGASVYEMELMASIICNIIVTLFIMQGIVGMFVFALRKKL
jgi:hypothetical protein